MGNKVVIVTSVQPAGNGGVELAGRPGDEFDGEFDDEFEAMLAEPPAASSAPLAGPTISPPGTTSTPTSATPASARAAEGGAAMSSPDGAAAVFGVGGWFQPLAGGVLPLPRRHEGRHGALLTGRAGAVIHAVSRGVVELAPDGELLLRTDDGRRVTFRPMAAASWSVEPGQQVEAGAVLGTTAPEPDTDHGLFIAVSDAAGVPLAADELLVGLPDPAELGSGSNRAPTLPLPPDPYELDLKLAREQSTGTRPA